MIAAKPQSPENDMYDAVHLARLLKMSASLLGRKHLGSISITDYNPTVEDQRTGRLIAEFFYQVCIGICQYENNRLNPPKEEEEEA